MTPSELLSRAHLPLKYPRMTAGEQRVARMEVLSSWFDPDEPRVLCNNVDNFVAAHFLWCEYYYKGSRINKAVYYYDDPVCKYDMVRMAMSDPLLPEEPAKSVVHATRRLCKTQTLVIEMPALIAINRPGTEILISENNADRTAEEMLKIKAQIEDNELIRADYGGEGVLYPTGRATEEWNAHALRFTNNVPKSVIKGYSIGSSQRGRGPLLGIIDDPEDDDTTWNVEWRRKFFTKLFGRYLQMFAHNGCKVVWIGTKIHGRSCLAQALDSTSEAEGIVQKDTRFNDWNKRQFRMIEKDPAGKEYSQQPQRLSVQGFYDKIKAIGLAPAMAEFQGDCVSEGNLAFDYDRDRNGYVRFTRDNEDFFYDCRTGFTRPWKEFLESLETCSAMDPADGTTADSCPGAFIIVGSDPEGIRYVLDAWAKQCLVDELISVAVRLSKKWKCSRVSVEKAGLQGIILRLVRKEYELNRNKRQPAPAFIPLSSDNKNKTARILTMVPDVAEGTLKFPVFEPVTSADGNVVEHVKHPNKPSLMALLGQLTNCTDQGIAGFNDLADALEMAIRSSDGVVGKEPEEEDTNDRITARREKIGLQVALPYHCWTPNMMRKEGLIVYEDSYDSEYG